MGSDNCIVEVASEEENGARGGGEDGSEIRIAPSTVVAVTFALSVTFTVVLSYLLKQLQLNDINSILQIALLQDFVDCVLDWVALFGANGEGDLTFSNDESGVIFWTLVAIASAGTLAFFIDLCNFGCGREMSKFLWMAFAPLSNKRHHHRMVRIGCEDFS